MRAHIAKPFVATVLAVLVAVAVQPGEALAHPVASSGTSTTTDKSISGTTWTTLASYAWTDSGDHTHECVAIASSDAKNPFGGTTDNDYLFVLTLDQAAPSTNTGSERSLEFNDNTGVSDAERTPVTSTLAFSAVPAGTHTIRWMARKVSSSDATMIVEDSSLSVVCSRAKL